MGKIIISSDNHIDVNRLEREMILDQQAQYLIDQKVDVYLMAGDWYNYFEKTLRFAEDLQDMIGPKTIVRFLAGNHEMGHGITFDELEQDLSPLYFHNKSLKLGDLTLIGNNGWYDYSFAQGPQKEQVSQFKNGFYYDGLIKQPMSDFERTTLSLNQIQQHLAATSVDQKVLMVQHFVPHNLDLSYPAKFPKWQMINGVMGSQRYVDLYRTDARIQQIIYGHAHLNLPMRQIRAGKYYNVSVGYRRAKAIEWTETTFFENWVKKLYQNR
ncbi:phosphoesterase [Weissella coleopterorum]|uniref:Phosphoesterase n=1 Tax=Weissella coleopterorum TaxID=2714949 RepID=A0A6G8AYG0_9LACO|nr:metallophosphoesterase [Weissella coleopterorum]QIL50037.1 phosphoesterase [Weissella coleopterorum]